MAVRDAEVRPPSSASVLRVDDERLDERVESATLGHHADVAQLVERDLAKVEVAGSSPVVRSSEM